jgi:hypothetical protein
MVMTCIDVFILLAYCKYLINEMCYKKNVNEDSSNSDWITQGRVTMAMEAKHLFDFSHLYELTVTRLKSK